MRRSTSLQGCSSASPAFGFDAVPGSLYPPPAAMSSLLCAPGVISILRRQVPAEKNLTDRNRRETHHLQPVRGVVALLVAGVLHGEAIYVSA